MIIKREAHTPVAAEVRQSLMYMRLFWRYNMTVLGNNVKKRELVPRKHSCIYYYMCAAIGV